MNKIKYLFWFFFSGSAGKVSHGVTTMGYTYTDVIIETRPFVLWYKHWAYICDMSCTYCEAEAVIELLVSTR